MQTEDDMDRPVGAGSAVEQTWSRLHPEDAGADERDLPPEAEAPFEDSDSLADDGDEDDAAQGGILDDPVDLTGSALGAFGGMNPSPEDDPQG